LSFRAKRSEVENGAAGEAATSTGRLKAERTGSERIKSLAVWIKNRDSSTSLGMTKKGKAYARAGVDIDLGNRLKRQIQSLVKGTHGPRVLGKIGGFGGLFEARFPRLREPVLVASIDGVGTKLKIAFAMDKHDTIGADLVNHCVNDIAVLGARPLFFLDYIGCEKLEHRVFQQLLRGFARACRSAGCALLGGETAQMPGMYRKGEYDLAGCIVGVVDRAKIIDGQKIKPGDVILGLASNGLHTNGYSLAREILFRKMRLKVTSRLAGSTTSVGEELLRVHKNYQPLLANLPDGIIKGLAHITGGGLIDNLPRILPPNCDAVIEARSWHIPGIFQILQQNGNIDAREMYQVFNMGIGMVAVVAKKNAQRAMSILRAKQIGTIERGSGQVRLEF
jgi:phosphoribosylformylglycinamidine cyclo-ligase